LLNWALEHAVEVAAVIVGLTYIMIPYVAYRDFFGYFRLSLNAVGFDRSTILTGAALAFMFTLVAYLIVAGLIAASWATLETGVLLILLGLEKVYLGIQALRQYRLTRTNDGRREISRRVAADLKTSEEGGLEASSPQVHLAFIPKTLSWFHRTRQGPLRRRLLWVLGGMIGTIALAAFLWFQIPEPSRNDRGSYLAWIGVIAGLWCFVILMDFLSWAPLSESTYPEITRRSRTAATAALQTAIAGTVLLLLFLSSTIGHEAASYTDRFGEFPDLPIISILDVDVRCVTVRAFRLETNENSTRKPSAKPTEPMLYLAGTTQTVILYNPGDWNYSTSSGVRTRYRGSTGWRQIAMRLK
jgi:hypothetical protein